VIKVKIPKMFDVILTELTALSSVIVATLAFCAFISIKCRIVLTNSSALRYLAVTCSVIFFVGLLWNVCRGRNSKMAAWWHDITKR